LALLFFLGAFDQILAIVLKKIPMTSHDSFDSWHKLSSCCAGPTRLISWWPGEGSTKSLWPSNNLHSRVYGLFLVVPCCLIGEFWWMVCFLKDSPCAWKKIHTNARLGNASDSMLPLALKRARPMTSACAQMLTTTWRFRRIREALVAILQQCRLVPGRVARNGSQIRTGRGA
jgi:hypothetical protein